MLERLLFLRPGELRRLLPFFCVYLFLFAAFAVADALALAMFVKNVGGRGLAEVYGMVAVANLVVIGLYVLLAERWRASWVLQLILLANIAIFGVTWRGLLQSDDDAWYETLFVCREVAFTLVLMHFGTFLQDYFSRDELNRVLPLVYAGGRVGGLAGGLLLQYLSDPLGLENMLGVFMGLCLGAVILVLVLDWLVPRAPREPVQPPRGDRPATVEEDARTSYLGFLRFAWQSPLLFWISLTTLLFIICRWMLNYQYTSFLGEYFQDEDELAEFLGIYTQVALVAAIVVQVVVVNRLIGWLGLKGAHLIYGTLLLAGMLLCLGSMTLTTAMLARFVETELRFGLRNPIQQLLTNQFPKTLRVRVRAWSFGTVIPIGTMASSILLGLLGGDDFYTWIPWAGAACGLAYFLTTFGLLRSFDEPTPRAAPTEMDKSALDHARAAAS